MADGAPVLYVDAFSGVSGDMLLGALVDAGADADELRARLASLPVAGYTIETERFTSHGLTGTRLRVRLDDRADATERHLSDIETLIAAADLPAAVRERALAVFRRLGRIEAGIHGTTIEAVHFHEVGGVDSIVDIVGVMLALDLLGVRMIYASSLPMSGGAIRSRHGLLPAPAPATLALLAEVNAPTRPAPRPDAGELVTPTGAAILAELATFTQPPLEVARVGYGFGTKQFDWPNLTRVWLGQATNDGLLADEVAVIETNLDDATGESLGYAMERLFAAGALDVYFSPLQMKKNRPGVLLGVIAPPARARELAAIVLNETSSLGVRIRRSERLIAPRRVETVETPYGPVRVKIKTIGGRETAAPEYEDCARIAGERGVRLAEVYAAALATFHTG
ncbi:MAG: nickel pincer cofactor biosynthesis protein LarC [Chloroflexota bacterium]